MNNRKIEELDMYNYKVIIRALNFFESELYHLEIEQKDYEEFVSKLERNFEKIEYNSNLDR